jgi:hypothetical protein
MEFLRTSAAWQKGMQGERDFGFWGNLRTHVQKKLPS